jgi:L-serine dehydratase
MDWCRANDLAFWQLAENVERDLWSRLGDVWDAMVETIRRGLGSQQIILRARWSWRDAPAPPGIAGQGPQGHAARTGPRGRLRAGDGGGKRRRHAGGHAPSCGAAGVLPAVLYFFQTARRVPRRKILEALATAGLFGASIRANATVSGAEAGCQAEIGSACSMAAAAAAQLCGATLHQIEYAAEMAMEHNLGLTCDPVEGYVQIPCIERNMNAALRAIECAAFTLLTDGRHLIHFDDAIEVMNRTGRDLQAAYRETATGAWRSCGGATSSGACASHERPGQRVFLVARAARKLPDLPQALLLRLLCRLGGWDNRRRRAPANCTA